MLKFKKSLTREIDGKEKSFKIGDEVPKDLGNVLLNHNREYLDIEYKDGIPDIDPKEEKFYSFYRGKIIEEKIKKSKNQLKPRYNMEFLTNVYNKAGLSGLKEIGKEFDPPVTDRSHRKLMNEILVAQESERS